MTSKQICSRDQHILINGPLVMQVLTPLILGSTYPFDLSNIVFNIIFPFTSPSSLPKCSNQNFVICSLSLFFPSYKWHWASEFTCVILFSIFIAQRRSQTQACFCFFVSSCSSKAVSSTWVHLLLGEPKWALRYCRFQTMTCLNTDYCTVEQCIKPFCGR